MCNVQEELHRQWTHTQTHTHTRARSLCLSVCLSVWVSLALSELLGSSEQRKLDAWATLSAWCGLFDFKRLFAVSSRLTVALFHERRKYRNILQVRICPGSVLQVQQPLWVWNMAQFFSRSCLEGVEEIGLPFQRKLLTSGRQKSLQHRTVLQHLPPLFHHHFPCTGVGPPLHFLQHACARISQRECNGHWVALWVHQCCTCHRVGATHHSYFRKCKNFRSPTLEQILCETVGVGGGRGHAASKKNKFLRPTLEWMCEMGGWGHTAYHFLAAKNWRSCLCNSLQQNEFSIQTGHIQSGCCVRQGGAGHAVSCCVNPPRLRQHLIWGYQLEVRTIWVGGGDNNNDSSTLIAIIARSAAKNGCLGDVCAVYWGRSIFLSRRTASSHTWHFCTRFVTVWLVKDQHVWTIFFSFFFEMSLYTRSEHQGTAETRDFCQHRSQTWSKNVAQLLSKHQQSKKVRVSCPLHLSVSAVLVF